MFTSLDISTSGLTAQRTRMDVISGNIANANVTEDSDGAPNPYRRRFVVFQQGNDHGVQVANVQQDMSEFVLKNDPGHRDAIKDGPNAGCVRYPNIDVNLEYINAIEASRAYEANLAAFELSKNMIVQLAETFGMKIDNNILCHCERSEAISRLRLLRRVAPRNDRKGERTNG